MVRFMSGMCVTVRPERWSVRVSGGGQVTRRQLPLRLAWAISIHKSQVRNHFIRTVHIYIVLGGRQLLVRRDFMTFPTFNCNKTQFFFKTEL